MQTRRGASLLAAAILLSACYHATIETGLTPSTHVLEQSFASSWIYGLVPPKTVETASRCPDGVARVETQHTFVNQLVGFLTLGIYTPMHIRVTCAQASGATSGASLTIPEAAGEEEVRAAFGDAADFAARTQTAVTVRFER
jgi:Bor protein